MTKSLYDLLPGNIYDLRASNFFWEIFKLLWGERPSPAFDTEEVKEIYGNALLIWNFCPKDETNPVKATSYYYDHSNSD